MIWFANANCAWASGTDPSAKSVFAKSTDSSYAEKSTLSKLFISANSRNSFASLPEFVISSWTLKMLDAAVPNPSGWMVACWPSSSPMFSADSSNNAMADSAFSSAATRSPASSAAMASSYSSWAAANIGSERGSKSASSNDSWILA